MTDPVREPILDADLVALVHGELDPEAARRLRARLTGDADAQARHAALAATDEGLCEALDTHDAPGRDARRHAQIDWWRPLLGIAAVLVVAAVFVFSRRDADEAIGKNEFVELKVAPRGGASHPLFTEVALELRWKSLVDATRSRGLQVQPFAFGATPAALAESIASSEIGGKLMPLVVSADLHAPDGTVIPARLRPDGWTIVLDSEDVVQVVTLRDFEVQTAAPRPYLGGAPGDGRWVEDFLWANKHMPHGQTPRWFPDQPGEWRIELRVDSLPPPVLGAWPTFAEPLVVKTAVVLTADVSSWGTPHDGLRARLVFATGCADVDHAPTALQIENQSGRTRKYNVTGTTIAKIPQPFHFDMHLGAFAPLSAAQPCELFLAGEQRGNVGVITAGDDLMSPHPDGTIRTLVVCADYWRFGTERKRLGDLQSGGLRDVRFEFHFEPSLWDGADTELWMGKLSTGAVRIAMPKRD